MIARLDTRPDDRKLAQFSEAGMFALGMVLAPAALLRGDERTALIAWVLAVILRGVGALRPQWLRVPWIALSVVTLPIGWIVATTAMIVLWWLVVTPIGLALRWTGRDVLGRRFDPSRASYWTPRTPRDVASYLRRF